MSDAEERRRGAAAVPGPFVGGRRALLEPLVSIVASVSARGERDGETCVLLRRATPHAARPGGRGRTRNGCLLFAGGPMLIYGFLRSAARDFWVSTV